MIFPQGYFSVEAMSVLKARNFLAAVNTTPHPAHRPASLKLRELAQPAVLRYSGFPLFLRQNASRISDFDIAFRLFFGRPVLIVEHHETFRDPGLVLHVAGRIHSMGSAVNWANLGAVTRNSYLWRQRPGEPEEIRAFATSVSAVNAASQVRDLVIGWEFTGGEAPVPDIRNGDQPIPAEREERSIRALVRMPPGSAEFSLHYPNPYQIRAGLGWKHWIHAAARRRLSELRDNYLSRSPGTLAVAKALQRRIFS
jgi:hypothetical protein